MDNNKTIIKGDELLFLFGLVLYFMAEILNMSILRFRYDQVYFFMKVIRLLSYALLGISLTQMVYSLRKILCIFVLFAFLCLSVFFSRYTPILYTFLILLAALSSNSKRIFKVLLVVQISMIVVILFSCWTGIIEDEIFNPDTRQRHFLGFSWVTTSAILFLFISWEYILVRQERISLVELLLIEGIHVYFYVMTDTRMGFLVGTASVVIILLYRYLGKYLHNMMRFIAKCSPAFPFVFFILSFLMVALYRPEVPFWSQLNDMLSDRLRLGASGLSNFGITLFGQNILWQGNGINGLQAEYNYVDCSYIKILFNFGVIFTGLVLAAYSLVLVHLKNKENYIGVLIVTFILIFSVTEPRLWDLTFNPIPILLIDAIKEENIFHIKWKLMKKNRTCKSLN